MRIPKWMFVAVPIALTVFIVVGGWVVMSLWNWLAPTLFGLHAVTFWQALGLLVLCRILFGGFGFGGGHRHSRRSRDRMAERWMSMTPEERENLKRSWGGRMGFCGSAGETKEP